MREEDLIDNLADILSRLKTSDDKFATPLFKKVIKNNIPIWTAINDTPSVAFYISHTEYTNNRYSNNVVAEVVIFIYNRHKKTGLSLDDILSPLVTKTRYAVKELVKDNDNIISADIIESNKDGGTILPYTVAELVFQVEFVETPLC